MPAKMYNSYSTKGVMCRFFPPNKLFGEDQLVFEELSSRKKKK